MIRGEYLDLPVEHSKTAPHWLRIKTLQPQYITLKNSYVFLQLNDPLSSAFSPKGGKAPAMPKNEFETLQFQETQDQKPPRCTWMGYS